MGNITSSIKRFLTKLDEQKVLNITLISLVLGRCILFIFHDSPVRTVLWNQDLLSDFLGNYLSLDWSHYSNHYAAKVAKWGDRFFYLSYFFILVYLVYPFKKRINITRFFYCYAFIMNLSYALLNYVSHAKRFGILLELSIQTITPILCLLITYRGLKEIVRFLLPVSVAFTFIGHGLFAYGFYPVPGHFIDMTIGVFSFFNEYQARVFLKVAAILDLIIAIAAIYTYFNKYKSKIFINSILVYAVFWGFITSFARYTSYISKWIDYFGIQSFIPQVLFRVPHWTLPLMILIIMLKNSEQNKKSLL